MNNKNTWNERGIEDLLTPDSTPEPPAGLAERIKAEIPDSIEVASVGPDAANVRPLRRPARNLRPYLLAASVLTACGAAFVAYRLAIPAGVLEPEPSIVAVEVLGGEREGAEDATEPSLAAGAGQKADESFLLQDKDTAASVPAPEAEASPRSALPTAEAQRRREARQKAVAAPHAPTPASPSPPPPPPAEPEISIAGGRLDAPQPSADGVADDFRSRGAARKVPTAPEPGTVRDLRALGYVAEPKKLAASEEYQRQKRKYDESGQRLLERRLEEVPSYSIPPSTGGTAEPNDKPYGDVFFEGYGTNPFIDTEDDRLSTFGLDVDTASYTVVRRYLSDGNLPDPDAVRVEEMINYFDYGDPAPGEDDFALYAEGAPSPFGESERYYLLRFHLKGNELDPAERRPANLTFVIDVSGSMARENRLGLVKRALDLLIGQLRRDDRVALVVYGSRGRVVLEPTSDHERLRRAIEALQPEGSTNAEEGLVLAYELAGRELRRGRTNRVILCSDGVANVGRTSAESILDRIAAEAERGIELTTVGFGMGNYNDVLMEQLANRGNGRYAYVDTLEEARRIFVENLTGTLQTIAAEARVQVDFNPEVVERYRLLGYENRDIADERFRDDTVDAGEIGAGHAVTALYEVKLKDRPGRRDHVATLHLRYGSIAAREMRELSRQVTGADFARELEDASPQLQLTAVVAEFAEILKHTYWAKGASLGDVFVRAQRISARFPGDHDVAEFVTLVSQADRLSK